MKTGLSLSRVLAPSFMGRVCLFNPPRVLGLQACTTTPQEYDAEMRHSWEEIRIHDGVKERVFAFVILTRT
jgi:hypothetical protein